MPRRGKKRSGRCTRRNKAFTGQEVEEPKELKRAPHTFVIHRGYVGTYVRRLVHDFRKVMEPYTASALRVMKRNKLKDFVSNAGMLHVTHMCIFTRTDQGAYMKIARIPKGPTLSFRVHNYTLTRDVISSMKKQFVYLKQFEHPPLIVLNGFSGEGNHIKLMASTFQNMFPTISIIKVNLSNVLRCVLINYDPETKLIDFRHYAIKVVPAGLSRSVKKLVQNKVPNLSRYQDISEYLTNPGQLSESEIEDDPASHVVLPQTLSSRGNLASSTSAIRLIEIGPRLTLELLKIEVDFFGGDVLFHSYITKSNKEVKLIKQTLEERRRLKQKRKNEQAANVKKKELMKEMQKEKCIKGIQNKYGRQEEKSSHSDKNDEEKNDDNDDDNDVQWYKEEVGENPDPDLFTTDAGGSLKRKKPFLPPFARRKKMKVTNSEDLKRDRKPKYKTKKDLDSIKEKKKFIGREQHSRSKPRKY